MEEIISMENVAGAFHRAAGKQEAKGTVHKPAWSTRYSAAYTCKRHSHCRLTPD